MKNSNQLIEEFVKNVYSLKDLNGNSMMKLPPPGTLMNGSVSFKFIVKDAGNIEVLGGVSGIYKESK